MSEVSQVLQRELIMSESSSSNEEADESGGVERHENDNSKKNALAKKEFVALVSNFVGKLPESPLDIELEPLDYFNVWKRIHKT